MAEYPAPLNATYSAALSFNLGNVSIASLNPPALHSGLNNELVMSFHLLRFGFTINSNRPLSYNSEIFCQNHFIYDSAIFRNTAVSQQQDYFVSLHD
ncbi:hypothetical protein [Marinobacter sp. V034]|uniref:hypothetical protein n=1 Tax=Marinobacter sp. V034 TaxID=3459610 RepID=UPI004044485F